MTTGYIVATRDDLMKGVGAKEYPGECVVFWNQKPAQTTADKFNEDYKITDPVMPGHFKVFEIEVEMVGEAE